MLQGDLFKLLDTTGDAAYATTDTGEIRFWNAAAEKLFGYSAARALNRACDGLLNGRGVLGTSVCPGHCQLAATGRSFPNFDMEVITLSGQKLWVSLTTLLFADSRNHNRLIVHIAHDISRSKRVEQLVSQLQDISRKILELPEDRGKTSPIVPLSETELQVLRRFSQGSNSNEVARVMGITLQTLRNHLHHINQKLRTHSRVEALAHALRRKLI